MPAFFLALLFLVAGSVVLRKHHEQLEHGASKAVLDAARRALSANVRETSANSGPIVDEYLRQVGIAPPANWCAAAVSAWMREGFKSIEREPWMHLSAQAKAFIREFEKRGRWIPKDQLKAFGTFPPGSVPIWSRGDPSSWTGHIGVLEKQDGNMLHTIEGNSGPKGDRVARMERKLDDPRLLGIGLV